MRNACMNMIYELAKTDPRVIFIASDLTPDLLPEMKKDMPDRYYMEGVAEANMVGMAAGFAKEGYLPYVVTIGAFMTRRCYEQIALDVCLQNLPVRVIGVGGGLNYAPLGPTHQAIEDIAIMRALPNMTVVAVCDADEMKRLMPQTISWPRPLYIRLAKGFDPIVSQAEKGFEIGKAILMREASQEENRVLMISTGVMTTRAMQAAEELTQEGIDCTVLHMHTVKPLDGDLLATHARGADLIITIEEHTVIGGLGSACLEALSERLLPGRLPVIRRLGLPDRFADEYGTQDSLMETFGLQPPQIVSTVRELVRNGEKVC